MNRQAQPPPLIARVYRMMIALYPAGFRAEFGEEMQAVFMSALEEQGGEGPLWLFWREMRHWPGSALKAHLRARSRSIMTPNGFQNEKPLPPRELLAAMIIFLLPLFSLFLVTEIDLPGWTDYVILVIFWGSILFALGLAIARRLPGWSLPYLGFVLMLGVIISPVLPSASNWIYPHFLETFGSRRSWPIPVSILYAGIFEFVGALMILLGALVLVNLLRFLPYTRNVWKHIRADWTQLSFMMYGGLVFSIVLTFDEYRYAGLWKFSAWACLAIGAWLYLRGKRHRHRVLALLGGMTASFWIVALAKWLLIPLQMWPTGYPIAPSVTSRWVETVSALLSWLFILGILVAPALIKWLPPLSDPPLAEEDDPASAQPT